MKVFFYVIKPCKQTMTRYHHDPSSLCAQIGLDSRVARMCARQSNLVAPMKKNIEYKNPNSNLI